MYLLIYSFIYLSVSAGPSLHPHRGTTPTGGPPPPGDKQTGTGKRARAWARAEHGQTGTGTGRRARARADEHVQTGKGTRESLSARAVRESPLQEPLCESSSDGRDGGDAQGRTQGRTREPSARALCKVSSARAPLTDGTAETHGYARGDARTHGDGTERQTVDKSCSQAYLQKSLLLLALTQLRIARTKRKRKSFPVRGRLTTATPPNLSLIHI